MAEEYTIWFSAVGFVVPSDSVASLEKGRLGDTTRIATTNIGGRDQLLLPLTLPSNVKIKKILIGCSVSNERSIITQIRLTEEREPPSAFVIHDDGTDHTNVTPTIVESVVGGHIPNGGITLNLIYIINNIVDTIDLGSVGIVVETL